MHDHKIVAWVDLNICMARVSSRFPPFALDFPVGSARNVNILNDNKIVILERKKLTAIPESQNILDPFPIKTIDGAYNTFCNVRLSRGVGGHVKGLRGCKLWARITPIR